MRIILGWSEESLGVQTTPRRARRCKSSTWPARRAGTAWRCGSGPGRPRSPSTARNWRTAGSPRGRSARSAWRPGRPTPRRRPGRRRPPSTTCGSSASPSRRPASRSTPPRTRPGSSSATRSSATSRGADAERVGDRGRRPADRAAMGRGRRAVFPPRAGPGDAGRGAPGAGRVAGRARRSGRPTSISSRGRSWPQSDASLTLATPYAGHADAPAQGDTPPGRVRPGPPDRPRRLGASPGRRDLGDPSRSTRLSPEGWRSSGRSSWPRCPDGRPKWCSTSWGGRRGRRFAVLRPGPQRRAAHLRRGQRQAGRLPESPHQDGGRVRSSGSGSPIPRGLLHAGQERDPDRADRRLRPAAEVRRPGHPSDRRGVPGTGAAPRRRRRRPSPAPLDPALPESTSEPIP